MAWEGIDVPHELGLAVGGRGAAHTTTEGDSLASYLAVEWAEDELLFGSGGRVERVKSFKGQPGQLAFW